MPPLLQVGLGRRFHAGDLRALRLPGADRRCPATPHRLQDQRGLAPPAECAPCEPAARHALDPHDGPEAEPVPHVGLEWRHGVLKRPALLLRQSLDVHNQRSLSLAVRRAELRTPREVATLVRYQSHSLRRQSPEIEASEEHPHLPPGLTATPPRLQGDRAAPGQLEAPLPLVHGAEPALDHPRMLSAGHVLQLPLQLPRGHAILVGAEARHDVEPPLPDLVRGILEVVCVHPHTVSAPSCGDRRRSGGPA
eukprot:CAMPEP_0179378434 /NCGR_PEP_ID=MMETSP0797-20121207/89331_1 /TAXON_ID=47934 /ORGANISM="Dinophysis acuminata, Strain DAEP01" /LENGTH=250 /DNA_ID=CAMNT_0021094501 /DNA_START=218 /DNA_END=966 /DNA_ORIENTATION=+